MIYLGILFLIVGIVAMAFERTRPATRPLSTFAMYVGLGVGIVLVVVGIFVLATQGDAIQVDSQGEITVA